MPKFLRRRKQKIDASEFRDLIDLRNESSLEMKVDGTIDLFFSDSDMPIREQEVRRYLPQISPFGVILMHDASSHLKQVREAALKAGARRIDFGGAAADAARAGGRAKARRAEVAKAHLLRPDLDYGFAARLKCLRENRVVPGGLELPLPLTQR